MLFFRKKRFAITDVMSCMTDCHCHILPSVDDGIKTYDEAFEVLSYFEKLGVRKIILTPHIMEEYPLNRVEFLRERFRLLQENYKGGIELSLGAEYMLDNTFEALLETDNLIPIFDNYLLVETSYANSPINFYDILGKINAKGYHIVLAHPERYLYMNHSDYKTLKSRGVRFQLNLLSLTGAYGKQVKSRAEEILTQGFYNCIGSDLHNQQNFEKGVALAKFPTKVINRINEIKGGL